MEIFLLKYDTNIGQTFLDSLDDVFSQMQHFILKKKEKPRKKFHKRVFDLDNHYVIKMRALDSDTMLDFALFDSR